MVTKTFSRQNDRIKIYRLYLACDSWRGSKKNELKPWKVKGWVIPPAQSSELVSQMEYVLDIYNLPYDADYPVICMAESPRQLFEEVASTPIEPGREARLDYEHKTWNGLYL